MPDLQSMQAVAKPGPSNASNIEIADTFNHQVEADLLFVDSYVIFHFIDRCTRWHAAMVIPDKKDVSLVKALDACWITIHGPPKEFITDGETGITQSPYFQAFLKRKGIKPVTRAKGQHARFIERRGALVRDAVHRTKGQLEEE